MFEKRLGKIVKLIEQGVITPCFVVYTFKEFETVLHYEKFVSLFEKANTTIMEIREAIQSKSIILDDPKIIPSLVSDIADNYILAVAKQANAELIVTGDKLLLSLKHFEKTPIITPQKFLHDHI